VFLLCFYSGYNFEDSDQMLLKFPHRHMTKNNEFISIETFKTLKQSRNIFFMPTFFLSLIKIISEYNNLRTIESNLNRNDKLA